MTPVRHAFVSQADVIPVCRELGIAVVCYSPLGRGFLTGQIKSYDDIPDVSRVASMVSLITLSLPNQSSDSADADAR
jgi:aryl-alcohol dehydrogenase-like predicted oxidoreductase